MKKNEIKQRLERSVNEAPMDVFARIQETPVRKMERHDEITRQRKKRRSPILSRPVALGVSMMIIMIFAVTGWYQYMVSPDSHLYFDVNPGVEIVMNRREQVIDLIGINEKGKAVVEAVEYKGEDLAAVQHRILEEMVERNILESSRQIMLVSALHRDPDTSQRIAREFDQGIHRFFGDREMELVVFRQSIVRSNTLDEFGEIYNLSIGKMTFIRNLMILNSDLELEDLVERSLEELLLISMDTGLELDRIIETDDDYREFELPERPEPEAAPQQDPEPEPQPEPRPEPQPDPQPDSRITLAGLEEVLREKIGGSVIIELDYDKDDREYEITMYHEDYEYELEIDAFTGRIKEMDRDELDEDEKRLYQKFLDRLIGIGEVERLTLSRIGGGYIEEIELDEDEGRWIYEIEALYNGVEYELEIDAYTGEILKFERDDSL